MTAALTTAALAATHVDVAVPLRADLAPGLAAAVGVEVARSGPTSAAVDLGLSTGQRLRMGGPYRSVLAAEGLVETDTRLDPRHGVGVAAGVSLRDFRQREVDVAQLWTPVVGVRGSSTVVGAPRWAVELEGRVLADLIVTRLQFPNGAAKVLSPIEGAIGLRVRLGRREEAP